ncbi:MAG: pantoate--beta-alanine ligase [Sphingomicrobium sp.]
MQTVHGREELARALAKWSGERVALVPTMGALHAGHLKLVAEARTRADRVVTTIFVNPLQFGAGEDLAHYPRREAEDAELLDQAGCDLLWLPAAEDIYPDGFATSVHVAGLTHRWEGEARPGHFDGVATVVAKLLIAVRPDVALFGEKDFQQLAVIRAMVRDLALPIEIVGVETVRDTDGLALSSRNTYLSKDERKLALALPTSLIFARDSIRSGKAVTATLAAAKQQLVEAGFLKIDYLALVDSATLEPLDRPAGEMRLIAAATLGKTRLIDNLAV